jgi:hypothetical protein
VYPRGPPPPRKSVQNTKVFPSSGVGRLISAKFGGFEICTAVLVGRRHIVTASKCALWSNLNDDSPPGPMIFQPGYNNGQVYPVSSLIYAYWLRKVDNSNIEEDGLGGDLMVGVVDRDMQRTNGIFGQQLYNRQWNGRDLWSTLSYGDDVDSKFEQQIFQSPMAVTNTMISRYGEIYVLEGSFQAGDPGAPVYALFQTIPRIIGVTTGQFANTPFQMVAQGGLPLFGLIAKAIKEYP